MPLWVTKGTARPEHSSAAFAPSPKIGETECEPGRDAPLTGLALLKPSLRG
jgi:hypothetical protein